MKWNVFSLFFFSSCLIGAAELVFFQQERTTQLQFINSFNQIQWLNWWVGELNESEMKAGSPFFFQLSGLWAGGSSSAAGRLFVNSMNSLRSAIFASFAFLKRRRIDLLALWEEIDEKEWNWVNGVSWLEWKHITFYSVIWIGAANSMKEAVNNSTSFTNSIQTKTNKFIFIFISLIHLLNWWN